MDKQELLNLVRAIIKSDLKIRVREQENRSECSYSRQVIVELLFEGEVIDSKEIPGLEIEK